MGVPSVRMLFALAIICNVSWVGPWSTTLTPLLAVLVVHDIAKKNPVSHPQEKARNVILDPSNNRDNTWDGQSFDGGDKVAP